jgi:hypothetical protein
MSIFRQKAIMTMEVVKMELRKIKSEKNGNEYAVLSTFGRIIPNGVSIAVDKLIKLDGKTHEFMIGKIEEFKGFVGEFETNKSKGLKSFASVSIKPKLDKKGNVDAQYDKVKTDTDDNGNTYHKIDAWATLLESEPIMNEERTEVIDYKVFINTAKGKFDKNVSDISTASIEACMYFLTTLGDDRLVFTSGMDQYATELIVDLNVEVGISGTPTVGQAYKMIITPTKGKRVSVENNIGPLSFDDDVKDIKTTGWEKDKMILTAVGAIRGENLDGLGEDNSENVLSDILGI